MIYKVIEMRIDTTKRISHTQMEAPILEFADPIEYALTIDQTVEDVLSTLQSRKQRKEVEYFYITDNENILQGVLSVRDLIYTAPKTRLSELIETDVITVLDTDHLEKGLNLLTQHQLLAMPVVDKEKRLVGILEILPQQHDSPFTSRKVHYKNLREDLFQFIGFSIELRKKVSPWLEFRYRMPWLLCNLVGGLICAVISEFYQATLLEFVILAFFIPLVLTLSESIAIQSMTLSLRFLHIRKIHWGQIWRRLFIESKSSLLLGVTSATIIGLFYFAWSTDWLPVISICLSVVVAMMSAALFGALFPIILHSMRLDPKVAAGPVVLMIADIFTIAIYLTLGTVILMN